MLDASLTCVYLSDVDPNADLNTIEEKNSFAMVLSSHVVEHQLDLVRHFRAVSKLLVAGGYYTLIVSTWAVVSKRGME
jgi:hypothetical protein